MSAGATLSVFTKLKVKEKLTEDEQSALFKKEKIKDPDKEMADRLQDVYKGNESNMLEFSRKMESTIDKMAKTIATPIATLGNALPANTDALSKVAVGLTALTTVMGLIGGASVVKTALGLIGGAAATAGAGTALAVGAAGLAGVVVGTGLNSLGQEENATGESSSWLERQSSKLFMGDDQYRASYDPDFLNDIPDPKKQKQSDAIFEDYKQYKKNKPDNILNLPREDRPANLLNMPKIGKGITAPHPDAMKGFHISSEHPGRPMRGTSESHGHIRTPDEPLPDKYKYKSYEEWRESQAKDKKIKDPLLDTPLDKTTDKATHPDAMKGHIRTPDEPLPDKYKKDDENTKATDSNTTAVDKLSTAIDGFLLRQMGMVAPANSFGKSRSPMEYGRSVGK